MKTHRNALLLALTLIIGISSKAMHAQVDQSGLALQILSDNIELRNTALAAVEKMAIQDTDRDLRQAVFAALQQEATLHSERYHAGRRGEGVEHLQDPEFVGKLSRVAAGFRDPDVIPALAAALFTGPLVARALADFGERAAESVLHVVTTPDGWYDSVDGGLVALRFMIERRGEHALTARTIAQILAATQQRLTGKQYFTTLWRAIDLAAVLGDPKLRQILVSLASDPNEAFTRGVENPDLLERTRQLAADRVAGIPALPRP